VSECEVLAGFTAELKSVLIARARSIERVEYDFMLRSIDL